MNYTHTRFYRSLACLIAAVFLMVVSAGAVTRYVSASSGNNANNGSMGSPYATIAYAISQSAPGDVISVDAGSYSEVLNIGIALSIVGPNQGIPGTGVRAPEAELTNCDINISGGGAVSLDGFRIFQTNSISDVISIASATPATIQNNRLERFGLIAGAGTRAISTSSGAGAKVIQDNFFSGDPSGGLFGGHKTWQSGVYVNGAASSVSILDNTFEICRTALNLDDYNNGIVISGNSFSNCGTFLSFGGVLPTNGQFVLGANDFATTVDAMVNLSNVSTAFRLDMTSSSLSGAGFNTLGLADLFTVESRMYHRGRSSKNGLVYVVAGNQYVVGPLTTIQSAVNYGAPGDVITVAAGSYVERVSVTKPLTIQGENKVTTIVTGTGVAGLGSGFLLSSGVANVTIRNLTVQNFAGVNGNSSAGIYAPAGNNNLTVTNSIIRNNVGGSGIYANGPISNVLIDGNTISGHTVGARGIVIWNALKQNIAITNNEVFNNNCCGIELQDGTASGVTLSGNNVHDNADNGIGVVGLQGPGANLVSSNTLLNNGRFGIEIKNPNGSGAVAGPGSIVVDGNSVSLTNPIVDARDIAGIAVFRRGVLPGNVDVPRGTVVSNNTVSGYVQPSTSEGFGIVMEGMNHSVTTNALNGNDIGIQRQAGHLPYPGDGNQNNLADQYFGRGNSPVTCGVTLSGNTFSGNAVNTRDVGSNIAAGIVTNTNTGKSYCAIQAAINDPLTLNGHTITVSAGIYNEDVIISKQLSLIGAGYANTTVSGPIGGTGATMQVASSGVLIDGFAITRDGNNTTDWNNPGLNFAGVAVQGAASAEVRNSWITGNRTGIDINNSNGNSIHNNIIDNNRTGLIFRNQTDNTNLQENFVTGNWTVGVLFLDASGGSNVPVQSAANSSFNNNNISGNWYGDVVDRQSGGSLPAPGSNLKNFECNWYGTTSPVSSTANSAEPGYAAQIPVAYGGTATPPGGQPNILGPASANIDYTPWLTNGTDDNATAIGFQPVSGSCNGNYNSPVITCPDDATVNCDESTAPSNTGTATATANCGGTTVTFTDGTPVQGNCAGNYSFVRTWTATDGCNNQSSCPQTITVQDLDGPNAVCQNVSVTLVNGSATITPAMIDNNSTDDCSGIASASLSKSSFTCADIGPNTVTLTLTDGCGNTSSCTATVTVVGAVPPSCSIDVTPSNTTYTGGVPTNIYLGYGPQSATITANAGGDPGLSYSWSPSTYLSCTNCQSPVFTPAAPGTYTYTVVASNANGCSTSCQVTFCVLDIRVPGGNGKVYVCHVPNNDPANANTLMVASNAVAAHMSHAGDRLGRCDQQCGSSSRMLSGGNRVSATELLVYPNPNNGSFVLEIPQTGDDQRLVSVSDLQGKVLHRQSLSKDDGQKHNISLTDIARGVYFVEVSCGSDRFRSRLIIR